MNPGVGGAVFAWLATGWTVGQARWAVGARAALIPAAGFLFCLATMMSLFFTSAADVPTWRLLTNLAAVSRDFCMIAWFLEFRGFVGTFGRRWLWAGRVDHVTG
jgi:hypothetical protein